MGEVETDILVGQLFPKWMALKVAAIGRKELEDLWMNIEVFFPSSRFCDREQTGGLFTTFS